MIRYLVASAKVMVLIVLVSSSIIVEDVYAEKMKVAFINPTHPNEPFWGMMTDYMVSAAKDLDIELKVYYSQSNRFKSLELAQQILSSSDKPDFLIFHFQAQVGARMLEAAEAVKVHSFVVNTNIPESDVQEIGKPREKYQYWLGHMVPEDKETGYILASTLVERASKLKLVGKDGKIHMIGLTGTSDNMATFDRNDGLRQFVDNRVDVILHQNVKASWDKEKAYNATKVLMARYPETSVVWAASDGMALGAIQAIEELGLQAGKDVLVGGVDGSASGLEAVNAGKMEVTLSGHFTEGAWALVLLYDFFQGVDFADDLGTMMHTKMEAIHQGNIKSCIDALSPDYIDQLDFTSYSKVANPKIDHYQFTLP